MTKTNVAELWEWIQNYAVERECHQATCEYACSNQEEEKSKQDLKEFEKKLNNKIGELTGWIPEFNQKEDKWEFKRYETSL